MMTQFTGCIVWYWPALGDGIPRVANQPLAAIVAGVNDSTVNLAVFAADGHSHARPSVPLLEAGDDRPAGNFCEWPSAAGRGDAGEGASGSTLDSPAA